MSRRYSQDRLHVDEPRPDAVVLPFWYATPMPEPWDWFYWHQWLSAWADHTLVVCENVWRHQGAKLYAAHRDHHLKEDLKDWLWVTAVESAAHFVPNPDHPAPERQWAAWLYKNLTAKARYHFGEVVGVGSTRPGQAARSAHQRGIASTEALDERESETGFTIERHPLHGHMFEAADPVNVIIRLEGLREAEARAHTEERRSGKYQTNSTVCLINLCSRPTAGRGLCRVHYNAERRDAQDRGDWDPHTAPDDPCEVEDCQGDQHSKGLCRKHYERWLNTGTTDARAPRLCSVEGCNMPHKGRGYCQMHLNRVRATGSPGSPEPTRQPLGDTCSVDDCEGQPKAAGRCNKHYHQWRKENAPPCAEEGCEKPSSTRGLCPGHYQSWRKARDTGEATA